VVGRDSQIVTRLRDILEPAAWAIQQATDNAAALVIARKKSFDLILTSEKTPGREDIELPRKSRRLCRHARVIILADQSTPADAITSMRERVLSYFSKPFSSDCGLSSKNWRTRSAVLRNFHLLLMCAPVIWARAASVTWVKALRWTRFPTPP